MRRSVLSVPAIVAAGFAALSLSGESRGARPAAGGGRPAQLAVCPKACRFATIAEALSAARTGDTIRIARGRYSGGFTIMKKVVLIGAGANQTTISGGGTVLSVAAGVSATIARVTITGGAAISGGGVRNRGQLKLMRSVISGNSAAVDGGGIYNTGALTLTNSSISDNTPNDCTGC